MTVDGSSEAPSNKYPIVDFDVVNDETKFVVLTNKKIQIFETNISGDINFVLGSNYEETS